MREWSSLFTDIVGSTEKAVAPGDSAWVELLERHHAAVRRSGADAAYRFSDRGLHELKGVPGALQLFTVEQSA